ncbi:MAG: DEAD/DEAH box helicase family protein [Clostridia bacterium]|nr:DEAD/DEAH box helicase family protein [Clostridia bacterium]
MKAIQLRPYQIKAIKAIQGALDNGQKHIVVEMATGTGKGLVLAKAVELLHKQAISNVLVVTNRLELKENIERNLFNEYSDFVRIEQNRVVVTTEQKILHHTNKEFNEYQFVIFDEFDVSESVYEALNCKEKTIIVFSAKYTNRPHRLFTPKEVVFSYALQEAINDGYITPAMDAQARGPALEVFSKHLLESYGYSQIDYSKREHDSWDLVLQKNNQKLWVECKAYKSQDVSPHVANELLKTLIMRKMNNNLSQEDTILLIVSSNIPSFQKDEIYKRFRIVIWDIENLVFYCKNNLTLLKQLAQITYFPIDHIEGQPSAEAELANLILTPITDKHLEDVARETNETEKLLQRLYNCPAGKGNSKEYEEICEEILRYLFEANYFNRLTSQHKTTDEHFRMDLIGSLKITQNSDESMHPLLQMLVQHYNSHFVVFEFKNYTEKIDQNLIYITEKYLFAAALRNVAFIISREGFSDSAKFAAEGCLKEHGKLILDITNEDLIKMLKSPSDNPADHLLTKLEDFLMGISK